MGLEELDKEVNVLDRGGEKRSPLEILDGLEEELAKDISNFLQQAEFLMAELKRVKSEIKQAENSQMSIKERQKLLSSLDEAASKLQETLGRINFVIVWSQKKLKDLIR